MNIIDGRKLRGEILAKVKEEIATLPFKPIFCDVLVGEDPASIQYVNMKARTAETVGIHFHKAIFPATITTEDLIKEIKILNDIENMCGIIVQLPLPPSIDRRAILDSIDPNLDVDCLGAVASERFYNGYKGRADLGFPTALACMALLDSTGVDLQGKIIVVMGQGELVGKPVAALLRKRDLSFQIVTSKTENKEYMLSQADVVISGIGRGKYITGNMIKFGAVLIDAGTSEDVSSNNKNGEDVKVVREIVGDVDLESVRSVAGYISPVPGGVGPVTVAMLLYNVLTVAKLKAQKKI